MSVEAIEKTALNFKKLSLHPREVKQTEGSKQ
jgi:hypothetical protein